MKLIYFLKDNKLDKKCAGIYKKVYGQLRAYSKYKISPILIFVEGNNLVSYDFDSNLETIIFIFKNKLHKKISIYNVLISCILQIQPDCFYIRYPMSDMFFLKFLNQINKKFKNIKISIEFPTYPYDQEPKTIATKFLVFLDKIYRNNLYKYVDFAVTYTEYSQIYNIKTVFIENGIDLSDINISNRKVVNNEITLFGIANVSFWHGFDRVITGINKYYTLDQKKYYKIKLLIAGEGDELENLKNQVLTSSVTDYVEFLGYKTLNELDIIFDQVDIGVSSLGVHRKNIFLDSTLKSREYCARGVPFIFASNDKDFNNFKYALKFDGNDDFIDMNKIIQFYEELLKINYKQHMREFAENNLSWDQKIKKIVEKFNHEKSSIS